MARRTAADWDDILDEGARIVRSYTTRVSLRQLFYRLIAARLLRNTRPEYSQLSARSAVRRRVGTFPRLIDHGRSIHRETGWESVEERIDVIIHSSRWYERDHSEGQKHFLVIGVEKETLTAQMRAWFGDLYIPIVPVRGYSSETYDTSVKDMVRADGRPAILLYVGDLDPSGEDIDRNFIAQTDCWHRIVRVAVLEEHLKPRDEGGYDLIRGPGKPTDSRARAFIAKYGCYVDDDGTRHPDVPIQVEVEALDPDDLRDLVQAAIDRYWSKKAHKKVLKRERRERKELARRLERLREPDPAEDES